MSIIIKSGWNTLEQLDKYPNKEIQRAYACLHVFFFCSIWAFWGVWRHVKTMRYCYVLLVLSIQWCSRNRWLGQQHIWVVDCRVADPSGKSTMTSTGCIPVATNSPSLPTLLGSRKRGPFTAETAARVVVNLVNPEKWWWPSTQSSSIIMFINIIMVLMTFDGYSVFDINIFF